MIINVRTLSGGIIIKITNFIWNDKYWTADVLYHVTLIITVQQVTNAVAKESWKILAWTVEKYERFGLGKFHFGGEVNTINTLWSWCFKHFVPQYLSLALTKPDKRLKGQLIISMEKCMQQSHRSWVQIRHSMIDFFRSLSFWHKPLISPTYILPQRSF